MLQTQQICTQPIAQQQERRRVGEEDKWWGWERGGGGGDGRKGTDVCQKAIAIKNMRPFFGKRGFFFKFFIFSNFFERERAYFSSKYFLELQQETRFFLKSLFRYRYVVGGKKICCLRKKLTAESETQKQTQEHWKNAKKTQNKNGENSKTKTIGRRRRRRREEGGAGMKNLRSNNKTRYSRSTGRRSSSRSKTPSTCWIETPSRASHHNSHHGMRVDVQSFCFWRK